MTPVTSVLDRARPLCEQDWPAEARPIVSVLCPTFNQERYIGPCLESILGQITSFPVEIIVHDDASTDGTTAIVQEYAGRFPRLIKPILQTENQFSRLRKIRPIMLGHATGTFIASCDGDDVWLDPHKLTKQVGFLRDNPSFVLSFHDGETMDVDGRRLGGACLPETGRRDYSPADLRVLRWGWILMGTAVYRNVKMEFPPEYDLAPNGDNFVPILLASFGAAKFQPEVGPLGRRLHSASMWSSRSPAEHTRMHLQTYLQIASYLVRIGEEEMAKKIIVGKLRKNVSRYLRSAAPGERGAISARARGALASTTSNEPTMS